MPISFECQRLRRFQSYREILHGNRTQYGKQVVVSLAETLSVTYCKSFEARYQRRMMQFAEVFPSYEIVSPLVSQLSWTHSTVQMGRQAAKHDAAIGLILCAEARAEQFELLNRQKDNFIIADYWSNLPPKNISRKS